MCELKVHKFLTRPLSFHHLQGSREIVKLYHSYHYLTYHGAIILEPRPNQAKVDGQLLTSLANQIRKQLSQLKWKSQQRQLSYSSHL